VGDVEDRSGCVERGVAVGIFGVVEEGGAAVGLAGGVDAGDEDVGEGVEFGLREDAVALLVLCEGDAGGDVDECVDGGEGVGEALDGTG
jgi:hypothetical protein